MGSIHKVRSQHKSHTERYYSAGNRGAIIADLQIIVHFDFIILKLHPVLLLLFLLVGQLQFFHKFVPLRRHLFRQLRVLLFSSLEREIVLCVRCAVFDELLTDAHGESALEALDSMTESVFVLARTRKVVVIAGDKTAFKIDLWWPFKVVKLFEEVHL